MIIRPFAVKDAGFVRALGRGNFINIGFIPLSRLETEAAEGRVLVCEENKDLVGYVYFSPPQNALRHRQIHQIAVRDDARRHLFASALLGEINEGGVSARCAADIAGVDFWRGVGGIERARLRPQTTRGREIIKFYVPPVCGAPVLV